jgi:hypothetical protein
LYYGTEQGLHGRGNSDLAVRESLWGHPNAFNRAHPFYQAIRGLTAARNEPALRYGRLYFRPVSGNGSDFGISPFPAGVIAASRILNEVEVLIVANTNVATTFDGEVIVDATLNAHGSAFRLLFSNRQNSQLPDPVAQKPAGAVRIKEPTGGMTSGPARTLRVHLAPSEIQLLRNAAAAG